MTLNTVSKISSNVDHNSLIHYHELNASPNKHTLKMGYNSSWQETYFVKRVISNQEADQVYNATNNHNRRSKEWNAFPPLSHSRLQSRLKTYDTNLVTK